MQVTASVLPIRRTPADDARQETQCLFGEVFTVYDEAEGWAWGQAAIDGYVGYVDVTGLSAPVIPTTHYVAALRTYRYTAPDLKSPPLGLISMHAGLSLGETELGFAREGRGGWVFAGHAVAAAARQTTDPVAVAQQFLGTAYFWGGRESLGLDCSALIQNAFAAANVAIPRDTDQQEPWFADPAHGEVLWAEGMAATPALETPLQRGDVIFWAGHVGIMVDARNVLHANATHMAVTVDDLAAISTAWVARGRPAIRRIIRPRLP